MTRAYTETTWNIEKNEREVVADWSFTIYPGDNNHITVCRNGVTKTVKVVEDREFVYKLQKTQVKAIDGANGLFNFIDKALFECFMDSMAWKVLRHCFFDCKAAA